MAPRPCVALLVLVSVGTLGPAAACASGDDDQAAVTTTATSAPTGAATSSTGPTTGTSASGATTTATAVAPRTIPVLEPVPFTRTPSTVDYEATGAYARLVGLAASVAPAVNDALRASAQDAVARFERDLTDLVGNVPHEPGVRSGIDLAPTAPLLTPQLASVRLDVLRYFEGAAHPESQIVTATFDLTTGRQLALADLFPAGQPYLPKVADLATADLAEQFAALGYGPPDTFGTAASDDNYRAWWLTADGLAIGFPAGQAGAYALGNQMATVPWSELRALLAPTGPVTALAR